MSESALRDEIHRLRVENDRLRALLSGSTTESVSKTCGLVVHYLYASPLVLLDNLGSTVIETLDPLRVGTEYKRIVESLSGTKSCRTSISVASPTNLLQLQNVAASSPCGVLHVSMHTVEVASAGGSRTLRCALEDDNGKGQLMSPDDFSASLGVLENVELVFLNACKSIEVGMAIFRACPTVRHVVCLSSREPVLESTALLFASEFYPSLVRMDVESAFQRSVLAVKSSSNPRVSSQADLFQLLPAENSIGHQRMLASRTSVYRSNSSISASLSVVGQTPLKVVKSTPFWIGHVSPDLTIAPEDFIGRQVETVRLCSLMFSGSGRRVCAVTGGKGSGKSLFLAEASKFFASPGGRHFSGGICVVSLPPIDTPDQVEDTLLQSLIAGLNETINSVRNWYGLASTEAVPASVDDDEEEEDFEQMQVSAPESHNERRPRFDSTMCESTINTPAEEVGGVKKSPLIKRVSQDPDEAEWIAEMAAPSALKSYKVFWADTFSSQNELLNFLDSYQLSLPEDSSARLFNELRTNGTQLQEWGNGRLIRVVHVVRLLIQGDHGEYLLENRSGSLRMLSKKFDPVSENVLEVASGAVYKELGRSVQGTPVGISKLVLRDRKPLVEINRTSPSYPGLATKYVLYTANVSLSGLPVKAFETTDSLDRKKIHAWEWTQPDSDILTHLLPDGVGGGDKSIVMQVNNGGATMTLFDHGKPLQKEFARLMREWASLCDNMTKGSSGSAAGLVLLRADEYLKNSSVRQLLGKALVRHAGLKILFTQQGLENKSIMNLTTSSVSYKIVHFPLAPLQPIDSAVLFTRRIHRPLYPRDWWVDTCSDGAPLPPMVGSMSREGLDDILIDEDAPLIMTAKTSGGVANLAKLARHPLLMSTSGSPERILMIAQHVTIELHSINELVNKDF